MNGFNVCVHGIQTLFSRLDVDHSGKISVTNLKTILGSAYTDAELADIVKEVRGSVDCMHRTLQEAVLDRDRKRRQTMLLLKHYSSVPFLLTCMFVTITSGGQIRGWTNQPC